MTRQQAETTSQGNVPVVILNGFLGSGKTTLMRSLVVHSRKQGVDLGVVVNDMSELDVDGQIVAQAELFEEGSSFFQSITIALQLISALLSVLLSEIDR